MALAGGALALHAFSSSGGDQPSTVVREAPFQGAWKAPAGFGSIEVERVERAASAVHGSSHGTEKAPRDELRISLTLTNRLTRPVAYSPGQFRLLEHASGTTVTSLRPNPPPGELSPEQTLRQNLTFLIPTGRASFALTFEDLRRARPLRIELGLLPRREE